MMATTIMAVIVIVWCGVTLAVQGVGNQSMEPAIAPNSHSPPARSRPEKYNDPIHRKPIHPLGIPGGNETRRRDWQRSEPGTPATSWLSLIGVFGIVVAFGHSILAMSGEETLAQVYREVESPKLKNFRRAALIVFIYSLVLTVGISFLGRAAHSRRRANGEVFEQPHRRAGDERDRAATWSESCSMRLSSASVS